MVGKLVVLLDSVAKEVRDGAPSDVSSGFGGGHHTALIFLSEVSHLLDSLHAHAPIVGVRSFPVTVTSHDSVDEVLLALEEESIAGRELGVKVGSDSPHF